MASRSHVDVNERRLRPIYDSLDNGNNKKAIQEADKVLKKQKDLHCAKVLKALALLRLGRHDESMAILREVHDMHPTNEATLTAMSICYREIHKLDLIADMYENAHKSKPDSEEILSSLFMAHVRLGNYKKQQQTAMQLHRLRPQNNPYYFWAVMSIVMQAHSSPDKKLAQSMYLPLAAKMTEKYVSSGKVEVESEVVLYIMILELLEKWEEAIAVLEGPLSGKFGNELRYREWKMAVFHQKLEHWEKANELYKKLLENNPDQFQYWKSYLETVLQLESGGSGSESSTMENGEDGTEKTADDTVEKAVTFMGQLIEERAAGGKGEKKYRLRGPYLAQLHLHSLLRHHKTCQAPEQLGSPVECLQQYFNLFGDKPCCSKDMKLYVDLLSKEEQRNLMEHLRKSLHLESEDGSIVFVQDLSHLYRHLTVLQLSHYLGLHDDLSPADKTTLACELIQRYRHGLEFGKDLLSTEFQHCDSYLILAAQLMARAWEETGDQKLAWQMIVQLELGMRKSPSNFQIKLLLVKLYCSMGAFGPCPSLYDSMEIKHIMNDTLGHIVSNHVGRLGHFIAACAMYGTMLRFFTVNHKETVEYLLTSYKYGSFSKIYEFVQFREKLQNSVQYASATAERLLLDMILDTNSHQSTEQMVNYMEIDPDKEKTNYDALVDNRDFTVMHCWDPPSRFRIEELQTKSFEEEKAWLHVRNLVLRMLACAVQWGRSQEGSPGHASNGVGGEEKCRQDVLSILLEELRAHLDSCQDLTQPQMYPLQGPFRTRISTYLQGGHHSIFTGMVDNCLYVGSVAENGADKTDENKEEKLQSLIPTLMEELVSKVKAPLLLGDEGERPSVNTQVLENLALAAETLSHVTILTGVCHRLLKPVKTAWAKKNKKKKEPLPPEPVTLGSFNQLVEKLKTVTKELHKQVGQVDPIYLSMDLSKLSLSQPLMPDKEEEAMENEVWERVGRSYQQSAREIGDLIHCKMLYLNELSL